MKILIVEDDKNRIKWFKENLVGHSADIVETAKLGIALCQTKKYDAVFLDHDLGGEIFVDSNHHNTGYQVAKLMAESMNKDTPTIVHSHNPSGAKNIKGVIKHAFLVPFCDLMLTDLSSVLSQLVSKS